MSKLTLLHITDLHLDDITSPNEKLRKAFYKEFIDGLATKISETVPVSIDKIICTGDFVNKGKVENFEHANIVINYLTRKFSLANTDVSICIGNHDVIIADDKSAKPKEARRDFYIMAETYKASELISETDFFKIFHCPKKDIYTITFDSTFGSNGENLPSKLTDTQIDKIITEIDDKIPPEKPLFVLSHYPMIIFNRSQVIAEEDNWIDNHLWKSGNLIVERCYKKRKNGLTFWFFGDGHLPDFWSYNNYHHFLMTGMIGGNYVNPTYKTATGSVQPYNKTNEAKVVEIDLEKIQIKINTFSYKSQAYKYSPHTGFWEHTVSDIRIVDNPFEKTSSLSTEESVKTIETTNKPLDSKTTLISTSVEDEIINQIRDRKLYSFNRYATSPKEVSLGWVSITKLFENRELLSRCIEKSVKWIDELPNTSISNSNTIFIGIDFWGAIFASQTSIIKSIDNYCIATKSRNQHNVLLEKPDFLCNKLQTKKVNLKNIILFTDVISTGNTVISIQQKIKDCLGDITSISWIAISIISDIKQGRKTELNNFSHIGALCTNLRIPLLNCDDLPDEIILPVKYDIR